MAVQEIELRIDQNFSPLFVITSNLSGRSYNLRFRWSVRWECWYMDLDETIQGMKVVNGVDLLRYYKYNDDVPQGVLSAVRNEGRTSKPYFDNFGIEKEITLAYEE